MQLQISKSTDTVFGNITISGSKSESNRLLILHSIFSNLKIENLSDSDDTRLLQNALNTAGDVVDIGHAGTAMRFLTALFSIQKNRKLTLTGSSRMQERPIKILVDALRSVGAQIEYKNEEGFPPISITGTQITKNQVSLPANVSSQYISALMLIAPALPNGLEIKLEGSVTSLPYIQMTLKLLQEIEIDVIFENQKIVVFGKTSVETKTIKVEPDWSSASYFYSIVALSKSAKIRLSNFKKNSLQGDSDVSDIYEKLGVKTTFEADAILLEKFPKELPKILALDLNCTPDLAQTIAVTCLGLGIGCRLSGLHTLKIKETDRLLALKTEIGKFGTEVFIDEDSVSFSEVKKLKSNVLVETYNDHRMAMAFAALAVKTNLRIAHFEVVSKSYPDFWKDIEALDFRLQK